MKRRFWLKVIALAAMGALSLASLRGDIPPRGTQIRALPQAKWQQALGLKTVPANVDIENVETENADVINAAEWCVVIALAVLILAVAVVAIVCGRKRKRVALRVALSLNILLLVLLFCIGWKIERRRRKAIEQRRETIEQTRQLVKKYVTEEDTSEAVSISGGFVEVVSPESSESYRQYLERVERLDRQQQEINEKMLKEMYEAREREYEERKGIK